VRRSARPARRRSPFVLVDNQPNVPRHSASKLNVPAKARARLHASGSVSRRAHTDHANGGGLSAGARARGTRATWPASESPRMIYGTEGWLAQPTLALNHASERWLASQSLALDHASDGWRAVPTENAVDTSRSIGTIKRVPQRLAESRLRDAGFLGHSRPCFRRRLTQEAAKRGWVEGSTSSRCASGKPPAKQEVS